MGEGRPRILIVDDDREHCEVLSVSLRHAGFEVLEAHSGNEALARLREGPVDVILSDMQMPDGDGMAFLGGMRVLPAPPRHVILFTGYMHVADPEARKLGATCVFQKPMAVKDLISRIRELLKEPPKSSGE